MAERKEAQTSYWLIGREPGIQLAGKEEAPASSWEEGSPRPLSQPEKERERGERGEREERGERGEREGKRGSASEPGESDIKATQYAKTHTHTHTHTHLKHTII